MSIVKSFSVGHGDMFYIKHNSNNFTIIDCKLSDWNRVAIVTELMNESHDKGVVRFISTHPDDDHICGLVYLDNCMPISNFYCVQNYATKSDLTDDFNRYRALRQSDKAYYISAGCERAWMNLSTEKRGHSGLHIIWPNTSNVHYKTALLGAALGLSPNNISAVIQYYAQGGASFLWMGDLETSFMENIEHAIALPRVDILFAPHHGRDSGKIPASMLEKMSPKLIVIGEAPAEHLNYYAGYDTITQNSAENITFDCVEDWVHVYVSNQTYTCTCLTNLWQVDCGHGRYVGSLHVGVPAAV